MEPQERIIRLDVGGKIMKLININKKDYKREFTFDLGREVKNESHVKVSFYVDNGGINYFTYKNEKKGYYVSIAPITRNECDGCATVRIRVFSGLKMLLKEISRKSRKSFNNVIEELTRQDFYSLCLSVDSFTMEELGFMYEQMKENWEE